MAGRDLTGNRPQIMSLDDAGPVTGKNSSASPVGKTEAPAVTELTKSVAGLKDLGKTEFTKVAGSGGGGGGNTPPPINGGSPALQKAYSTALSKLDPGLANKLQDVIQNHLSPQALNFVADAAALDPTNLKNIVIPEFGGADAPTDTQTQAYVYTPPADGGGSAPVDDGGAATGNSTATPPDNGGGGAAVDSGGPATGNSTGGPGLDTGGPATGNSTGGPGLDTGGPATGNSGVGGGGYDTGGPATGNSGVGGFQAPSSGGSSQWNVLSSMGLADCDLEAVAFIVLMQATSDMDEDLKMVMAEVKASTAAKAKLRDLIAQVNKDVAKNATQHKVTEGDATGTYDQPLNFEGGGLGSADAYMTAEVPVPNPESPTGFDMVETQLYGTPPANIDDLKAIQQNLKDKLDSMNEVSEMTSLRLQMIMDRRSKMISTLTNVMKKISQTQDNVVANLK